MNVFKQALGDICGGRVLDVATGEGGFVGLLIGNLKSYTEIVGIDASERVVEIARTAFRQEDIHFIQMDARRLGFENESFDTVNISASMHHLTGVPRVLAEMKRVLKRGGHFVMSEMHRDGQTEAQLTVVSIHHWAAEVDSALGSVHNRTLGRQELVDLVEGLGLHNVVVYDFDDIGSNPLDGAAIKGSDRVIDRYLQRVKRVSHYEALKQRGEKLRHRLHEVGVQREPVLVITGEKQ